MHLLHGCPAALLKLGYLRSISARKFSHLKLRERERKSNDNPQMTSGRGTNQRINRSPKEFQTFRLKSAASGRLGWHTAGVTGVEQVKAEVQGYVNWRWRGAACRWLTGETRRPRLACCALVGGGRVCVCTGVVGSIPGLGPFCVSMCRPCRFSSFPTQCRNTQVRSTGELKIVRSSARECSWWFISRWRCDYLSKVSLLVDFVVVVVVFLINFIHLASF